MDTNLTMTAFIAGSALTAGVILYLLGRAGFRLLLWGLCLALAGVFFALTIGGQTRDGWDGIGYIIIAVIVVMPAFLGAVLGGWLGRMQYLRRQKTQ
jgi:hypothetical protein